MDKTDIMNLSYLHEDIAIKTLSVPSVTGWEQMMRDFLITFADEHEMEHEVDSTGNVYLTKGNVRDGEYYPCVCAHMDTVQSVQRKWITENKLLDIKTEEIDGQHQYYCENFGLGADDKAGIAICLSLFMSEPKLKGVFFVIEEAGCLGSEEANLSWFRDVGYIIAYDSPGKELSWACGGARLFDREFYEKYLADLVDEFKIKKFCNHPYTDIMMLRRNTSLACMNVYAGYYHYHTNYESCIAEEMDEAVKLGKTMINRLGYNEYLIPYVDRMHDDHNEDDEFFFEKFGRYW